MLCYRKGMDDCPPDQTFSLKLRFTKNKSFTQTSRPYFTNEVLVMPETNLDNPMKIYRD